MTAVDRVLPRLRGVKKVARGWVATCPAHDDNDPSLSVGEEHGRALLNCFGGCPTLRVLEALGLRMADLFDDNTTTPGGHPLPPPPPRTEPTAKERDRVAWALQTTGPITDQGAAYLKSRGLEADAAASNDVLSSANWIERGPAVVFLARSPAGEVVGAQGRLLDPGEGPKALSIGPTSLGAYATDSAWSHKIVAITEAPLDALSLAVCGLPSIALLGTAVRPWLPEALHARRVLLATDGDVPGTAAARKIHSMLPKGTTFERIGWSGCKDANEMLQEVPDSLLRLVRSYTGGP